MTAPLHHINQMILHLPAINGQVAAHASIGQELREMAQKAQDQEYRRDLVELVSQANPGAEATAVKPERGPLARANLKDKPQPKVKAYGRSARASESAAEEASQPLINVRV
jgi:hypothetical protein